MSTATSPGDLLGDLADLIRSRRDHSSPMVAGVTGMDTSGKSRLSAALAGRLDRAGVPCTLVHADDFHRPRAERYVPGLPEPDQYYDHSIDVGRMVKEILHPLRTQGQLTTRLQLLDLRSDSWDLERTYHVPADGVLLLEGVFLFRAEVRAHVDLMVYLHVDESVVLQRAEIRDVPEQGQDVIRKYHEKYLPAQRRYLAAHPFADHADVVIDNNDWRAPVVLKWPDTGTAGQR